MQTIVGVNDPKAVKLFSAQLMVDISRASYFTSTMMGRGEESPTPIQLLTGLEKEAGDKISFDLSVQLRGRPVESDNPRAGNEEKLSFYTDSVLIDQMWKGVDPGGKMSRKRTVHNLRTIAKARLSEYFKRLFDEMFFIYLSGARGINDDYIWPLDWTGRAGNALRAPDTGHLIYGDGSSKLTLTSAGKMTLGVIDKCVAKAATMGGGTGTLQKLQPVVVNGKETYVMLMHDWSAYDLRRDTGALGWTEIQKAAAGADGQNSPIFRNALGMHNGVVMHKHNAVIRFNDYGAGGNVAAARSLFFGRQAGVLAFGTAGSGMRWDWHEEVFDRGNRLSIGADTICGVSKTQFNSLDFGQLSVDVACVDPNA